MRNIIHHFIREIIYLFTWFILNMKFYLILYIKINILLEIEGVTTRVGGNNEEDSTIPWGVWTKKKQMAPTQPGYSAIRSAVSN